MTTKSILLAVEDEPVSTAFTQALGAAWEATSVTSEGDAVAKVEERAFDAFLVDFNLGSSDASDLLNKVLEKRPETVRFLLAYEADLALVAAKVEGTPHILPKPIEPESLKKRVEEAVCDSTAKETPSQTNNNNEPPAVPPIYAEVIRAIETLGTSNQQLGELIAQDEYLTFETLRLTNSAYRGLPTDITDPVQAVNLLGLETIKALVMSLQFLAERRRLKPGYLSFDQLWQHSVAVGQIARDLILFEKKDHLLASQALVAGMVHDLGKVVLATNFDDLYGRVHSLARKQPVSLWDIEKEMFGANHGEIGACLVGMWNLPGAIVEATALHHEPPLGEQQTLTVLAAVHIANVLAHQLQPNDEDAMAVAAVINTPFLNELGLLDRLPVWHAVFANRVSGKPDPELEAPDIESTEAEKLPSATTSWTANQLRGPDAATKTSTSRSADRKEEAPSRRAVGNRKQWVYVAVAAAAFALLALWLRTEPEFNQPEPVYASTPAHYEVAAAPFAAQHLPDTAPARTPEQSAVSAVSEEEATKPTPAATGSESVASQPVPEPVTEASLNSTPTNVPPPAAQQQAKAKPDFRLNGIIYNSTHPFAIVNGQTVSVGDKVNGAIVVDIGSNTVTLQINGQRKVFEVRY